MLPNHAPNITHYAVKGPITNRMPTNSPNYRMWGHFEHSLDDKGRVIVPQKFRDKLGEEFVLTIGPGKHVRLYPMPVWDEMETILTGTDPRDELNKELSFLQRMFGNCEFASSDQQNRLSIPRYLRDWAGLEEGSPAIIVGSGNRLEFWSRDNWKAYSDGFTEDNADNAMNRRRGSIAAEIAAAVARETE